MSYIGVIKISMPNKDFISILIKELQANNSIENNEALQQFSQEDPNAQKDIDSIVNLWSNTGGYKSNLSFDKKNAWGNLQERMGTPNSEVTPSTESTPTEGKVIKLFSLNRSLAIAASIALLIGAFFLYSPQKQLLIHNEGNASFVEILPDGSKLTIAPGTSIALAKGYAKDNRDANQLSGQIFYDITSDKELPFQLNISDLEIEVTGTQFNIKSNEDIQLDLIEGSVTIKVNGKDVHLKAGEQFVYDPNEKSIMINAKLDPNATKWISNGLSFHSTPIEKVLSDIESFYGVSIDISADIPRNCHFTSPDLTNVQLNDLFMILLSAQGMVFDKHNDKEYSLVQITCKQ